MPPPSEGTRHPLKNLLICLSVANLCLLRRWYDLEHLQARALTYYRAAPVDGTLLWATLLAGLVLAAAFYFAFLLVERSGSRVLLRVAQCAFMALLILPLESVRQYWNDQSAHFDFVSNAALLAFEGLLFAGLIMAACGSGRILQPALRVAFLMNLLFASLLVDFAWSFLGAEPAAAYQPKASLPFLPARKGAAPRVIWVVFDEMDQRLAFEERPAGLLLPEFDRLRAEGLSGNQVKQTASWTAIALPSLLCGRIFNRAEPLSFNELRLSIAGSADPLNWHDQPNVFQRARELGVNAELDGWHHPYCRVIGDSLVRCLAVPSGAAALVRDVDVPNLGLFRTLGFLFHLQWEATRDLFRSNHMESAEKLNDLWIQEQQQQQYFRIRDRAYASAVDSRIGLLFLHFPTPHPYPIYDRKRGDFTLSSSLDYFDNLALADRTLGELRRALEQAGLWEQTSILVTADHGFRRQAWQGRFGWTPQLDALTASGSFDRVPFILKIAGQTRGLASSEPFSNVLSGGIVLSVLSGAVTTPAQAADWLTAEARKSAK
jgi:hypothetical protein